MCRGSLYKEPIFVPETVLSNTGISVIKLELVLWNFCVAFLHSRVRKSF